MLKDIRLPRIQPSTTGGALAWSADGDLAIAAGADSVVLNVNGPVTSRDDEIDSVRDRNWAQFPETNFTINKSDAMDGVPITAAGSSSIPGNQIQYGSGERHIADIAWSPTGLSRMHGCLLGLLNTTHELFIYDHQGRPEKHSWTLRHNVAQILYDRVRKPTHNGTSNGGGDVGDETMDTTLDNTSFTPMDVDGSNDKSTTTSRSGTPGPLGEQEREYTPEEYYSFQIHSFAWSPTLDSKHNYVAVGTGRGKLFVFSVTVDSLDLVASASAGDRKIVKLSWNSHEDGASSLFAVSDANEVVRLDWSDGQLSDPVTLLEPSRFFIAALAVANGSVAVSQPHRLTVVGPQGKFESPLWGDSNTICDIFLFHEKVLAITHKGGVVTWNPADNSMEQHEQTMGLLLKRLTTAKENNGSLNGVTPSFNTLDYEAVISGAAINPHGSFLSLFYAVSPRNVLKFPIPSTVVTRVAFVPLITPQSTSYDAVPLKPSSMVADESMQCSQWEFQVWGRVVQKTFRDEGNQAGLTFKASYLDHLSTQYDLSASTNISQHMGSSSKTLEDLLNSVFLSEPLDKARFSAFYDLSLIPDMQKLLFSLVLYFVSKNWDTVGPQLSGLDYAILHTYITAVGQQEPAIPLDPESALFDIQTEFISESFNMLQQSQDLEVIESLEGHTWRRCAITQLPILILDPLTPSWGPSKILNWRSMDPSTLGYLTKTLLTVFDLCPYTGTRYYENIPAVYQKES